MSATFANILDDPAVAGSKEVIGPLVAAGTAPARAPDAVSRFCGIEKALGKVFWPRGASFVYTQTSLVLSHFD
jgi:hypothetical protein